MGKMGYLQRLPLLSYPMLQSLRLGLDGNRFIHVLICQCLSQATYLHVVFYANDVCNIVVLIAGLLLYEHFYEPLPSLYKNQPQDIQPTTSPFTLYPTSPQTSPLPS